MSEASCLQCAWGPGDEPRLEADAQWIFKMCF